jgi:hypothetical protein
MFEIKVVDRIRTHFKTSTFFSENRTVYDVMPKYVVETESPQTIWRLRVASLISKITRAQARARAATHTDPRTRMSSPMRARAKTHTHTNR